ncbi:hypothetical protein M5689_024778 [Euphorbia peplus]|nr:hypothetical protein M5689_024778 [Euphorbia peplus]
MDMRLFSGVLPDNNEENPIYDNVIHLVNDNDLDFEDSIDKMINQNPSVEGLSTSADNSQQQLKRQKRSENVIDSSKKMKDGRNRKRSSIIQVIDAFREMNERTNNNIENKTVALHEVLGDRHGCSTDEVMKDVRTLPDLAKGSELRIFCMILFRHKTMREMYSALEDAEEKFQFIQLYHELYEQGKWKPSD